jgi:hypothetical protein
VPHHPPCTGDGMMPGIHLHGHPPRSDPGGQAYVLRSWWTALLAGTDTRGRAQERLMISHWKEVRILALRGEATLSSAYLCAERSSPMSQLSRCLLVCVLVGNLGLVSCATVLHSGPEPVTITSEPPDARVTITDLRTHQLLLRASTPVVAPLTRHAGYMRPARYQVVVEKPGYQPYVLVLQAELEKKYFGNFVAGGPLGFLVIDPLTGAMYALPSRVHAVLVTTDSAGAARASQTPLPLHIPGLQEEPPAVIR